jgi:release factor glutamine methyltransferase
MPTPLNSRTPDWTILKLLQWTTSYFLTHHIDSPRVTAEILLSHALNLRRIDLYLQYDQPLSKSELASFKSLIHRRINREPVAYITGKKAFWSLDLDVNPNVLIPRPDTECLVETALQHIPVLSKTNATCIPMKILDIGTGSGAVILSLAHERPGHLYCATDLSWQAILTAKQNSHHHNLGDQIQFVQSDWLTAFKPEQCWFDMIVCNPPYIPTADIDRLEPEVSRYEPRMALDGDSDGLNAYRTILVQSRYVLTTEGKLLLEMGWNQKEMILDLCRLFPEYHDIRVVRDDAGHDRVIQLTRI